MSQRTNYQHSTIGWCPACAHERVRIGLALRLVNLLGAIHGPTTTSTYRDEHLLRDLLDTYEPRVDVSTATMRHATLGERAERAGRDRAGQRKREAMARRVLLRVLDGEA